MPLLRFIPEATKIDFVGRRYIAFAIDGLLLLVSFVFIAWHGFNLGIDFTGGVLLEAKAAHVIDIGPMRTAVDTLYPGAQIQYFGGGECDHPVNSCVLIRVQPKSEAGRDQNVADQAAANAIKAKLGKDLQFRRTDVVGPKVSGELFHAGVLASMLAILM